MRFSARRVTAGAILLAVAAAGCGQAVASQSRVPTGSPRRVQQVDRVTAAARALYAEQVGGAHSLSVLHQVGSDPVLLRLLASGDPAGARAYVAREFPRVWYHWHVSRMRITQGSSVVTEVGVRFAMPASSMTLRGPGGQTLGKLEVSMQDEIGFVRLMHRRYPVQVVIRSPTDLRASLRAAGAAKLPASGTVRLAGKRYAVRSFNELDWSGAPVTIWILAPG